jgi:hypothetical protein
MKTNVLLIASAVAGIVCGLVSLTPFLAGQWANLVLWAVAGLVLGLFAAGRRMILWAGILFGVFLSFTFLLAGFQGSPDKLPGFLLLTLGLSVVGALGGLVTVFIGSRLRPIVWRRPS